MRRRTLLLAALGGLGGGLGGGLAGCGVPEEDRPRVVDPPVATGSPAARYSGSFVV